MAETTPLGIQVTGHATDIKGSVDLPGTREVLENMYNDFLDYKQVGQIPLDKTFESYIHETLVALQGRWQQDMKEKFWSGQMGRAEYEMWKEMNAKLISILKRADPGTWGFDNYGIQYIQPEMRAEYRKKVGKESPLTESKRDVVIKTSAAPDAANSQSRIIRP